MTVAEFVDAALYHETLGYYARRGSSGPGARATSSRASTSGPCSANCSPAQFVEMWRRCARLGVGPAEADAPRFDLVEAGGGQRPARARCARRARSATMPTSTAPSGCTSSNEARRRGPHRRPSWAGTRRCALRRPRSVPERGRGRHLRQRTARRAAAAPRRDARATACARCTSMPRRTGWSPRGGAAVLAAARRVPRSASVRGSSPGGSPRSTSRPSTGFARAGQRLERGFLVLIDYGHDAATLYSASHATGTLTTYRRHASERARGRARLAAGARRARHHLARGPHRRRARRPRRRPARARRRSIRRTSCSGSASPNGWSRTTRLTRRALARRLALKTLLLPGGLGSTLKVLVFAKAGRRPALRGLSFGGRLT